MIKDAPVKSDKTEEKTEGKKVYKAEGGDKPAKAKQPKPAKSHKPAEKKPAEKKKESKHAAKANVGAAITMISRAEDDIDQVEFSTMSIDVNEALKAFEEKYSGEDR